MLSGAEDSAVDGVSYVPGQMVNANSVFCLDCCLGSDGMSSFLLGWS